MATTDLRADPYKPANATAVEGQAIGIKAVALRPHLEGLRNIT
jgi:hypothetical protein